MRTNNTSLPSALPLRGWFSRCFVTLLAFGLGATVTGLRATVTVAAVFSDHAVLQHGMPVPVWGRAAPAEPVSVSYLEASAGTLTDEQGVWRVVLPALPPGQTGTLLVKGSNTVALRDVVTGEVWLCGGQSNMEWPVRAADNATAEIAAASYPGIRQLKVEFHVAAEPVATLRGEWTRCGPDTVGDFTAVGYFFARELHQQLKMPVGLINCSQGGSPIEAWVDAVTLRDPAFASALERWQRTLQDWPAKQRTYRRVAETWLAMPPAERAGQAIPYPPAGPGDYRTPGGLFNGMLQPVIPYALRGCLWYQGEANVNFAPEYPGQFAELVGLWRREWERPELPFLFVQLPNISDRLSYARPGDGWPAMRAAQAACLAVPGTGMAVTIDVGDPDARHPRNKQAVGHRLALLARARVYGEAVESAGPAPGAASASGDELRLVFDHAAGGLTTRDSQPPRGFEVADADGVFHPAAAVIDGPVIRLRAPGVANPRQVRYAWANDPDATLANREGLPAAPFRLEVAGR